METPQVLAAPTSLPEAGVSQRVAAPTLPHPQDTDTDLFGHSVPDEVRDLELPLTSAQMQLNPSFPFSSLSFSSSPKSLWAEGGDTVEHSTFYFFSTLIYI